MTDKPILFSGPMVRALLDGTKTQTRRLIKPQPIWKSEAWHWQSPRYDNGLGADYFHTPHVRGIMAAWAKAMPNQIGDRLWVRENCRAIELEDGTDVVNYPAGGTDMVISNNWNAAEKWGIMNHYGGRRDAIVPSIHMPKWASRITLTVTDVRVQRLQEITLAEVCHEGLARDIYDFKPCVLGFVAFRDLWDSLNAKRAPWENNPWIVAYSFTVERRNIDMITPHRPERRKELI